MKELFLIGLTTVLGMGCVSEDERDIVSEQFEHATAHSWLGDGEIFTELLDDQDTVIANATWSIAEHAGTIEVQEQSLRVEVDGSDVTRQLANQLTYASWAATASDVVAYGNCGTWEVARRDGCIQYAHCWTYVNRDGENRYSFSFTWDCYY